MSQPAHTFVPEDLAEARRRFEARKLTQDGWIWPVLRPGMRHGPTIRERMTEDLRRLVAGGCPSRPALAKCDLFALGWTTGQIATHGDRAINEFFRAKT